MVDSYVEKEELKKKISGSDGAPWLKIIERSGRGARYLIEKPSPLSDAITEHIAANRQEPIWLGRHAGEDAKLGGLDAKYIEYLRQLG